MALKQAKWNLVNHYLVVGLNERMEDLIAVLEKLLPNFFKGAFDHFKALSGKILTSKLNDRNTL